LKNKLEKKFNLKKLEKKTWYDNPS
jgi:hypothetical protein